MFTGIVEEVGRVRSLKNNNGFHKLDIECRNVLNGTKLGDSIAVNGVCLTVNELYDDHFVADVMGETLNRTNIKNLFYGSYVNLERALRLEDRLGGHIVSGHIDGVGEILDIKTEKDGTWFVIKAPENILRYVIYKGSICIDGASLTVAYVDESCFKVSVIPHTLENTILSYKKVKCLVNLECDLVGKYIEKLINRKVDDSSYKENNKSNITLEFLRENGF